MKVKEANAILYIREGIYQIKKGRILFRAFGKKKCSAKVGKTRRAYKVDNSMDPYTHGQILKDEQTQ